MLPFKLVYHEDYDLHLGAHVFPSQKYRLVREALLAEGIATPEDFLRPEPIDDADVLRVHDEDYVHRLKTGTLGPYDAMRLEIPAGPETVRAFWLCAAGTLLAARHARMDGFSANIGGGFHHAFAGHGEGFCMINDVAIAVRRMQADALIGSAMVVDTDVHHGNGTAAIFFEDSSVYTLSIHQENNYPSRKPPSNMDLHLPDRINDADYLAIFERGWVRALGDFHPDMIFYVGGADPYREDQLGGLSLTLEGLQRRDKIVFELSARLGIPVAITLAGGYARKVEDTVRIHCNTICAARDVSLIHRKATNS
ncbi:MAG: histone deacetylase [Candidatus Acidiferrales bacterium]